MKWRRIGPVYFRWEVKWADWWIPGYGPDDRGGWRNFWLTFPLGGMPCFPLHIKWRHDHKAEPMPVRIYNQHMRPLLTRYWALDGPEWAMMVHENTVTLPSGLICRVMKQGVRLDFSPPELYIMVYDGRPIEQASQGPTMAAVFSDWEDFYDAHPDYDPFAG